MRTKVHFLSFDEVLSALRTLGFDVQLVPEVANQFVVRKYGAGAILAHAAEPKAAENKVPQIGVRWRERPGYMVGGEVATLLDVSPYTVESHRTNLMQKLNVHNTAEIVLYAVRKRLVS